MPRIKLKPGSAEYADLTNRKSQVKACEMPGCRDKGEHKAPKDRSLGEYYHFCLEHVREYNKAWNFFEGMSPTEAQDYMMNSLYGNRPTWKYGVNGDAPADELKRKIWQMYHGHKEEQKQEKRKINLPEHTPEYEALVIMNLQLPLTQDEIKSRYKELVKKHHPDLNRGCTESEELLKRINMAYTILKLAHNKFEKLATV